MSLPMGLADGILHDGAIHHCVWIGPRRAADPGALPAYLALARLTADRALTAGRLNASDAERLLDVLGARR
jgi:hypothetical protein